MEHFEKIYEVFKKLILYYVRRLKRDEDAFQELNIFLIELLYQIPLDRFCIDQSCDLKNYIAVSIRNRYISYSKMKQIQETLFVDYCEQIAACEGEIEDFENSMIIAQGLALLTKKQKLVINYKYTCGYSDAEISEELHISRQAVHRLKTRGLLILKEFLENE